MNVDGIQNKRNQKNIMGKWTIDPFVIIKRNNDDDDDAKDRQRTSAFIRSVVDVIKNIDILHWKMIFQILIKCYQMVTMYKNVL